MAQPDFNVMRASMTNTANGLRTAATELDNANTEMVKIQNIAAVNMVNQLNQIQEQIRRMEQRILRQLSRCEKNNLARLFNSRVAHETHQLEPLYNMDDELIEDFPLTSADINGLDAASIERFLRELGLPVNGRLNDKKKRLRRHIGLMVL